MALRLSDDDLEKIVNIVVDKLSIKLPPMLSGVMAEILPGALRDHDEA